MNWDVDAGQRPFFGRLIRRAHLNAGTRTEGVLSNAVVPQLKAAEPSRYIQDLHHSMKKAICGVCRAKMQKSDNAGAY